MFKTNLKNRHTKFLCKFTNFDNLKGDNLRNSKQPLRVFDLLVLSRRFIKVKKKSV